MISYLLSKASTGKFRGILLEWDEQWHEEEKAHIIKRISYQYHGKRSQQPDILITVGKAGRSHREQATLQYNSEKKKYLDKGYREVEKDIDLYTEEELQEIYGDIKTDQNGFAKHMLAKSADKVKESSINKVKYWYASPKIDGVRASLYYKDGKVKTASRGGGDYDYSLVHIIENPRLIQYFENHPDAILDGEVYRHGKSLQQISGAARMEKNAYECDWLEFYVYDYMTVGVSFEERLSYLNQLKEELNLDFNPERNWEKGELRLQIVPHVKVSGYENIMKLHNEYVSQGWEGVVCRNPADEYGFGKRTNSMLKFKLYKSDEFLVTGWEEGLRGVEDMVFICETEDGISFKAKPHGSREIKEEYAWNFEEKYQNKMATIKYFYLSDDNCPLQPSLVNFRDDKTRF